MNFDLFAVLCAASYGYGRRGGNPYFDGDINRDNFAQVSQRALGALENVCRVFFFSTVIRVYLCTLC